MSRTQPKVLLEHVDKTSYKCDQIVEASGIWAVFYDSQPINLKSQHYLNNDVAPKYKKTSFSNPGHARNLCRKLNNLFKTDKFSVVFLNQGRTVYPDELCE
ncbi:MAG: hypothetical protein EB127_06370 [Alphaproteobacteria bacterium]|nr:hypothetical protein [Alphaproteobacteria bacterium]